MLYTSAFSLSGTTMLMVGLLSVVNSHLTGASIDRASSHHLLSNFLQKDA
jgi:hypothetical protein